MRSWNGVCFSKTAPRALDGRGSRADPFGPAERDEEFARDQHTVTWPARQSDHRTRSRRRLTLIYARLSSGRRARRGRHDRGRGRQRLPRLFGRHCRDRHRSLPSRRYRRHAGRTPDAYVAACLAYIEHELFTQLVSPDEIAAFVVEPIQGEGGYVVAPDGFLQGLRELSRKHGILLVVDEVQSGMGRTGKMFAIEHCGVEPDVVAMAKGIASGMPLGVASARADMMPWPRGAHASTFGGNPVSCAAALATITLLKEHLVANAADVGGHLMAALKALAGKHRLIGDVRGRGLMIGVELVRDRETKERATDERNAVVLEAFGRGLLILGAGKNSVRFSPPLVLTREQADVAVKIFDEALTEVEPSRHYARTFK